MVVHGAEGLCDLSIAGPTRVARWDGRDLDIQEVDCSAIGVSPAPLDTMFIASPDESAALIRQVLDGVKGPARDMVVFNAAAALWVAGECTDWLEGAARARDAIDSGAARETLSDWSRLSQ
jgi:anthranilate phosphoribosyltransferase